eukprot:GHVT01065214.1.p1 GENE.GHVT01065214.1~~GHVT01065214.1.p1  ORF type:complete len:522 (-),score=107.24 GHVT01065214.1:128-1693(-)
MAGLNEGPGSLAASPMASGTGLVYEDFAGSGRSAASASHPRGSGEGSPWCFHGTDKGARSCAVCASCPTSALSLCPPSATVDLSAVVNRVFRDFQRLTKDERGALDIARAKEKWLKLLRVQSRLGRTSDGNRVQVFADGDVAFSAMLRSIGRAKRRVWLESYIFDNSFVAELFVLKLREAARRGCDVILLVDWIGSFNLPNKWLQKLRDDGVAVAIFNPVLPSPSSFCLPAIGPIFFRDHRKILVADETAFCGSMNIAKEAAGPLMGTQHFYDTTVKVQGPAALDLADVFRDSLAESAVGISRPPIPRRADGGGGPTDGHGSSGGGEGGEVQAGPLTGAQLEKPHLEESRPQQGKQKPGVAVSRDGEVKVEPDREVIGDNEQGEPIEDCYVQILDSNVRRNRRTIQPAFEAAVRQASWSVLLSTSYFLPPGFLRRALLAAGRGGAEVSLLLSGNSDIPGDVLASTHLARKFLVRTLASWNAGKRSQAAKQNPPNSNFESKQKPKTDTFPQIPRNLFDSPLM